jgi:hypothetical protein
MENPREMTVVHKDYLQNIDIDDFVYAYQSLYQLFVRIYTDMMADPGYFCLPLHRIDSGGGADKTKLWHISGMVFALGMCGTLRDEIHVNSNVYFSALKKRFKITSPMTVVRRLSDYGLYLSESKDYFTVDYPDDRDVLKVIMAFGKKMSFLDHYIYNYQIHRLSPRCFESASGDIPGTDFYDYKAALGEKVKIVEMFSELMIGYGYTPEYEGFYRISYRKNNKLTRENICVLYRYDSEQKVSINIRLHNLGQYAECVSEMPESIKYVLCQSTCRNDCPHRGTCDRIIKYTIDGIDYEWCVWKSVSFENIAPEEFIHIKTLFENEWKITKSVVKRQFSL